jgi:hypothetical protein
LRSSPGQAAFYIALKVLAATAAQSFGMPSVTAARQQLVMGLDLIHRSKHWI